MTVLLQAVHKVGVLVQVLVAVDVHCPVDLGQIFLDLEESDPCWHEQLGIFTLLTIAKEHDDGGKCGQADKCNEEAQVADHFALSHQSRVESKAAIRLPVVGRGGGDDDER